MGIFSKLQNMFKEDTKKEEITVFKVERLRKEEEEKILGRIRDVPDTIVSWLDVIISFAPHIDGQFYSSVDYLLEMLGVEEEKRSHFLKELFAWIQEMGYTQSRDIGSELEYRFNKLLGVEEKEEDIFFEKIVKGLAKTRVSFTQKIQALLADSAELDETFWEDIESVFLRADIGYDGTEYLLKELRNKVTTKESFIDELEKVIQEIMTRNRRVVLQTKPKIIMIIGVNGAGKTTTVAKLANIYKQEGKKVLVVAGDTFRAAAIEQLEVWSKRLDVGFFAKEHGSDAASVAFEGVEKAKIEGYDVVLIDTAGRLHTKVNLMEELAKVYRVIKKCIPEAPHSVILVLDATIGQNALSQTELFNATCPIDEVILTKLDGTAKGGIAIGLSLQYKIPITYIGLGETMDSLEIFDPIQFTKALLQ